MDIVKQLYNKVSSAAYIHGQLGEWFHTHSWIRQGCQLSPTLFNIFLKRVTSEVQDDHVGTVSIGGRVITNLIFTNDIDGLASN